MSVCVRAQCIQYAFTALGWKEKEPTREWTNNINKKKTWIDEAEKATQKTIVIQCNKIFWRIGVAKRENKYKCVMNLLRAWCAWNGHEREHWKQHALACDDRCQSTSSMLTRLILCTGNYAGKKRNAPKRCYAVNFESLCDCWSMGSWADMYTKTHLIGRLLPFQWLFRLFSFRFRSFLVIIMCHLGFDCVVFSSWLPVDAVCCELI